ncbi:MAG: 23S rRNA (guanosine(2251)-2'-O)-methyltransferase RlmB [Actinomycetes bacterium]
MAGNSERHGARRNPGTKKGPTTGTGGARPKGLRGRGPTPPAVARPQRAASRRRTPDATGRTPAGRSPVARGRGPAADDSTEVVAGRNAVVEALRGGVPAKALYVASKIDVDDRVREAFALAGERGVAVLEATRAELDRLTGAVVHQGLALVVPGYDYRHPDDLVEAAFADTPGIAPLLVALDGVTDQRNLGAVIRSAAAFGAHGVVVPTRRAAGVGAGAWKASAGAAARVPVARATNLTRTLQAYRERGLVIVGLAADAPTSLVDLPVVDEPLVLVVGSEGRGLSRLVGETCDLRVAIPMAARTESLNAGVAAGIALYEVARHRRSR